jgi:hypothetical protein
MAGYGPEPWLTAGQRDVRNEANRTVGGEAEPPVPNLSEVKPELSTSHLQPSAMKESNVVTKDRVR